MKRNQKGAIDMMLVVALAIVLAVGGYVIYRISQTESTPQTNNSLEVSADIDTQQEEETNPSEEDSTSWQEESIEKLGLAFPYPPEWKMGELTNTYDDLKGFSVTSPNYETEEESIGGTTTSVGAIVQVSYIATDLEDISDKEWKGLLGQLYESYGVEEVKIAGIDAIQYEWPYEGDASLQVNFIRNGYEVTITFNGVDTGENGYEDTSPLYPVFEEMLEAIYEIDAN